MDHLRIADFAKRKVDELRRRLSRKRKPPSGLVVTRISSQEDFERHLANIAAHDPDRRKREDELVQQTPPFRTPGFCFVCQRRTEFVSWWDWANEAAGQLHVNWREHLLCPGCRLNNRMRAVIHLLSESIVLDRKSRIYLTEQTSPLFGHLRKSFPRSVGSEYLGDTVPLGQENSAGLRNEDLTRLTFPNESFDAILSFEVLEHIPDYCAAFRECARTLKPHGKMLFSVPFGVRMHAQPNSRTLARGWLDRTSAATRVSLRSAELRGLSLFSALRMGNARSNETGGAFRRLGPLLLFARVRLFGRRTNSIPGRKIGVPLC